MTSRQEASWNDGLVSPHTCERIVDHRRDVAVPCTMRASDLTSCDTLKKRGLMKSSVWTVLYTYWLRIACFGCTMSFTFVFPVVPFAALGWLVLGAFFWQDFFPVTWPWEFE